MEVKGHLLSAPLPLHTVAAGMKVVNAQRRTLLSYESEISFILFFDSPIRCKPAINRSHLAWFAMSGALAS